MYPLVWALPPLAYVSSVLSWGLPLWLGSASGLPPLAWELGSSLRFDTKVSARQWVLLWI